MKTNIPISITVKRKIEKYAEGVTPENGVPYEIIDVDEVYEGEEALKILKSLGWKGSE